MTDADKKAIAEAKGSSWKKILLWIGVSLVLVTLVTVLVIVLLQKKSPAASVNQVIDYAKQQNSKADMNAKIETAKARMVEESVINELKRIKEIDDEEEQAKRLAELL